MLTKICEFSISPDSRSRKGKSSLRIGSSSVFCYGRKPQLWPQPEEHPAPIAFDSAADIAFAE
jgi:hypothetical protein